MCGICGVAYRDSSYMQPVEQLNSMCLQLTHRGPDDQGMHRVPGLSLGIQRLSIIDRSGGRQPITNEDGTLWLVCNGEIYNYLELRKSLQAKGHVFATHTDIEVVLHLYEEEGQNLFERLRGMFAFALWDGKRHQLMLARDRLGIKPLYYTNTSRGLAFASEVKALLMLPEVRALPNLEALDSYLTFRYVPAPHTFFQGIKKIKPASFFVYSHGEVGEYSYWDYLSGDATTLNEEECAEQLLDLLRQTVRLHLQSEVPVGVFLSGGLDSSIILSLAASTGADLSTFSLGFCRDGQPHAGYWELAGAKEMAGIYQTRHRELEVSPHEIPDALPSIVWQIEEPLGDPTSIPLYFVSSKASGDATVILSGEGADEVFAGYNIYLAPRMIELFQLLPAIIRRRLILPIVNGLPAGFIGKDFVNRASTSLHSWYRGVGSTFREEEKAKLYSEQMKRATVNQELSAITTADKDRLSDLHPVDQMLYLDTKYWLPEDTLLKADKITMANSQELRVPFLDHKVVEFAASLPASMKVRGKTLKHILKQATKDILPDSIIKQRKFGFTPPISSWIASELRPYAEDLLTSSRFQERGYFNHQTVIDLLEASRKGRSLRGRQVYTLMVLELWHRLFIDGDYEELSLNSAVGNGYLCVNEA
jgi:asparagine synthase (glutamine-hydrolysing)